jgi:hypothetical protein
MYLNQYSPPPRAERPNLLIVRAGEGSLHPQWIMGNGDRNFDLLVSYYGEVEGRYREDADYYHVMRGPRWPAHDAICRTHEPLLASYEFVGFACDDLIGGPQAWSALFDICARYRLDLAQPAIEGPVSHEITRPVEDSILRYTNFVEIMAPVFSRRALAVAKSSFAESVSGWGLDVLWAHLLPPDYWRLAIVDAVRVAHSRPLRQGTLYPTLRALGVDPIGEINGIMSKFGLRSPVKTELYRITADGERR